MKKLILIILFAISHNLLFAQEKPMQKDSKIFFSSHFGLGKISGDLKENFSIGTQAMTGIEYRFNKHSSIVGELNFDGYGYKKKSNTFSFSGTVNNIPATIFYKYTFGNKKLFPYLKLGVGAAKISAPQVTEKLGFTTIENKSTIVAQAQAALGLSYEFRKGYIIFAESALQQYGKINVLANKTILAAAFRVGISTAL